MANLSNINNKFIVESDGDVGIGVTTALDKLNVGDGNIRISQVGNVASQLILNTYQSALGNTTYKWFVGQTTSANSYSFQIGNGTTPYLHINSLLFGAAAGNVGIGTTSPDAKLDVESTVDYQIMAKYNATNYTEYGYYGLNVVGGGNPYLFKLQGTERIRITSAGNIQFAQDGYINTNTADASDNLSLQLSGGGAFGDTRGACISLAGNENGNGGLMQLRAGDGSVGGIRYYTGGSERMRLGGRLISFNSTTGVQEIRGDVASAKFAIGNMGDASSQMMVSSRGFLTLNTSNTGSALDATERMRIDANGQMTYQGAEPGTTGIRFQGSGTCNGYAGSLLSFYAMDVMRDQGSGKAMNVQGTIDIAAGYGIGFGASAGGGATSTLLDDYEEGTWTPTISHNDGTGAIPLTISGSAYYVKVGRLVHVFAYLTNVNPNGNAGGSGSYYAIKGLPFTAISHSTWSVAYANTSMTSYGGYTSGDNLYFMKNGTNGQCSNLHVNGTFFNTWGANVTFMFQAVYQQT